MDDVDLTSGEVRIRKAPSGRALTCGIYQTDLGLETRAGYGEDLLRSQFAREFGRAAGGG